MATEKWIAGSGQGLTYGNAFTGSTLNSIASGNAILSDLQIDNSSALDIFCDVSIQLASAAGPPASNYWVASIVIVAATQAQNGTARGIILPPGKFKFVLYNQGGVALASSGNVCLYRTYNSQVA